ncbi:Lrp/AsnC family transcriptional regulator [Streptomyces malaysiensis]
MNSGRMVDATDARILLALADDPRTTVVALADRLRLSRNTVQARLAKLEQSGALGSFERRITPGLLGYPLAAFVTARVDQHRLAEVADALAAIAEVVEVLGLTGETDLLVRVVARYRRPLPHRRANPRQPRGRTHQHLNGHARTGAPPADTAAAPRRRGRRPGTGTVRGRSLG